ncbi:MAG: hypothetical protein AB1679_28225 [Actinomycetota bacterium]|jgi:plastocyanin
MNRSRRLIGALALLTVVGAACGDDNDNSATKTQGGQSATTSSTVAALTKAEFIAAADAICGKFTGQQNEIFGALFGSGGAPQAAAVQEGFGKVLDLTTQQIVELRALKPPAEDAAQISALWAEADKVVSETRIKIASADAAMELIQGDADPFAALNEKAKTYGFKDCAGEEQEKTQTFGGAELSADEQAKATKLAVEGFEYGYKGVPATVPAGPAVISFTNTGVESHEIGLVKIKPGVTAAQAIAKAKADPEDDSYAEGFLGAAYALKGEHTDLSVKLEPGLYGYGCFIEDPKGTPHAVHGMISTFTVR